MKSIKAILLMGLFILTGLCACSSNKTEKSEAGVPSDNEKKMLVCYFSATGTTAEVAERLAEVADADIYEIVPESRYTAADLDWRDSLSRSYVEMHNSSSRPAIAANSLPDMSKYDVIFIGYPNWWNTHPTIINTFIEANDFHGKTIAPFMTSGGDSIDNSEKNLKESYPSLSFAKGMLMNNATEQDLKNWIGSL